MIVAIKVWARQSEPAEQREEHLRRYETELDVLLRPSSRGSYACSEGVTAAQLAQARPTILLHLSSIVATDGTNIMMTVPVLCWASLCLDQLACLKLKTGKKNHKAWKWIVGAYARLTLNGRKFDSFGVWEFWKNSSDILVSLLQGWSGVVVITWRW